MVVVASRPAVPNAGSADEEALRLVTVAAEALHVKAGNLSSVRLIAMWLLLLALRMWAGGRVGGRLGWRWSCGWMNLLGRERIRQMDRVQACRSAVRLNSRQKFQRQRKRNGCRYSQRQRETDNVSSVMVRYPVLGHNPSRRFARAVRMLSQSFLLDSGLRVT